MPRVVPYLLAIGIALAAAAPASAADPLLSGYSAPGGGDQVLLGGDGSAAPSAPSGTSAGGSPSLRAPRTVTPAAPAEGAPVPAGEDAAGSSGEKTSSTPPASSGGDGGGTGGGGKATGSTPVTPAPSPSAGAGAETSPATVVRYPSADADAGVVGGSWTTLLALLGGLAGLLIIALVTARVSRSRPDAGSAPPPLTA